MLVYYTRFTVCSRQDKGYYCQCQHAVLLNILYCEQAYSIVPWQYILAAIVLFFPLCFCSLACNMAHGLMYSIGA
ncbi:hypothetical protein BJX62DRAFT_197081 [Aspergillus germanicus]